MAMIRKAIILGLALAAIGTGVVGLVGAAQALMDPGRFHGPNEKPHLHWLSGSWQVTSSLNLTVDRGKLAIGYSYLTDKGWATSSDCVFRFAGFSFNVSRRDELLLTRIARVEWQHRLGEKEKTPPFDPSRWAGFPPTGGKPGTTGWILRIPLLGISCLLAVYPIANAPLRRRRRRKRGECVKCAYDLTGNTSGVCPECGTPVATKPHGGDAQQA
jgi:hypothetical protein